MNPTQKQSSLTGVSLNKTKFLSVMHVPGHQFLGLTSMLILLVVVLNATAAHSLSSVMAVWRQSTIRATMQATSSGSGVIVHSDGFILSNNHVIDHAARIDVVLHDGTTYRAKVVQADAYKDLALLKIDGKNLSAAPLGNSDQVKELDSVVAIGFPLSDVLGSTTAAAFAGKLNARRYDRIELLQIDAAVNPGNSGGPLVNERGEVIGIIVSKLNAKYFLEKADIIPERVNFAIPLREALGLLKIAFPYGVPSQSERTNISTPNIFKELKPATVLILNYGEQNNGAEPSMDPKTKQYRDNIGGYWQLEAPDIFNAMILNISQSGKMIIAEDLTFKKLSLKGTYSNGRFSGHYSTRCEDIGLNNMPWATEYIYLFEGQLNLKGQIVGRIRHSKKHYAYHDESWHKAGENVEWCDFTLRPRKE